MMFLLACLLIELKPFPANGWGLDVYETAQASVAALISVGVSAGVFFALVKLLPLFGDQLQVIAVSGAMTFLFSNLIGLRQTKAQRLLGYSSIGQMGLLMMAVALLQQLDAAIRNPADRRRAVRQSFVRQGRVVLARRGRRRGASCRLVGPGAMPAHDPGVWHSPGGHCRPSAVSGLLGKMASGIESRRRRALSWIAIVLLGTLLEAAYLFRWFGHVIHPAVRTAASCGVHRAKCLPAFGGGAAAGRQRVRRGVLAGMSRCGCFCRWVPGSCFTFSTVCPGAQRRCWLFVLTLAGGAWLVHDLSGINFLFAVLLNAGGVVLSIACLYRSDDRAGFYPLLAVMLLALPALAAGHDQPGILLHLGTDHAIRPIF